MLERPTDIPGPRNVTAHLSGGNTELWVTDCPSVPLSLSSLAGDEPEGGGVGSSSGLLFLEGHWKGRRGHSTLTLSLTPHFLVCCYNSM